MTKTNAECGAMNQTIESYHFNEKSTSKKRVIGTAEKNGTPCTYENSVKL